MPRKAPIQVEVVSKAVKKACRAGLEDGSRVETWTRTIAALRPLADVRYQAALRTVFGEPAAGGASEGDATRSAAGAGAGAGAGASASTKATGLSRWARDVVLVPRLGGSLEDMEDVVGTKHRMALRRVVCTFAQLSVVQYCAVAAPLAALALRAGASEGVTFSLLNYCLKRDETTLPVHPHSTKALARAARLLAAARSSRMQRLLKDEAMATRFEAMIQQWLESLFLTLLPTPVVYNIVDAFLNEGVKVLLRIVVAVVQLRDSALRSVTTPDELSAALSRDALAACDGTVLVAKAFGLRRLARAWIDDTYSRVKGALQKGYAAPLPSPWYHPKLDRQSTIATPVALAWLFGQLNTWVDWHLVYSTDVHGWGLDRLYTRCRPAKTAIVLIEATRAPTDDAGTDEQHPSACRFGFFVPAPLRAATSVRPAVTTLFQLDPVPRRAVYKAGERATAGTIGAMFDSEFIAVGGTSASSNVAIRLPAALTTGTTHASDVFASPPLVDADGERQETPFQVACVEVFTLSE